MTTQECFIPQSSVNNRVCDCPGCEDEDGGGCEGRSASATAGTRKANSGWMVDSEGHTWLMT